MHAGLICWGIVIHGFIDGYSCVITGLHASNNNRAATVLNLFLDAAQQWGVPACLCGDHGVENLLVAAWMEQAFGELRGSYIWGRCVRFWTVQTHLVMTLFRSIHNVCIERLWVDVTAQVGATWSAMFTDLELHHSLDINNSNHIWLLHHLFLPTINAQLTLFAEGWNQHTMQICDGPNHSPFDVFFFDQFAQGIQGHQLPPEELSAEKLEVYGVDWEGLQDDTLLHSLHEQGRDEGSSSWIGRVGPPDNLGSVELEGPDAPLSPAQVQELDAYLAPLMGATQDHEVAALWQHGLHAVQTLYGGAF